MLRPERNKITQCGIHTSCANSVGERKIQRIQSFCLSLLHLCQSSSVFASLRQSSSVFVSLRQSSSVFVIFRQSSSVFVSLRQSSSVFVGILQSLSVSVSLPQPSSSFWSLFHLLLLQVPFRAPVTQGSITL